jgi:hypothetical protein
MAVAQRALLLVYVRKETWAERLGLPHQGSLVHIPILDETFILSVCYGTSGLQVGGTSTPPPPPITKTQNDGYLFEYCRLLA